MSTNFAIIGGDLRIVKLAKMLSKEENKIYAYGLEKAEELKKDKNITICNKIEEILVEENKIVISSVPLSSDGVFVNTPFSDKKILVEEMIEKLYGKILISGAISKEIEKKIESRNIKLIDIMKREELAILNTIATGEGTIELIISNTDKILQGSKVLILGFGRVGKTVAKKLQSLSAEVTCSARKTEDLAWIRTYGYKAININNISENLFEYDIIINTVPHMILTKEKMKHIKEECLLIDLASKPGGIDRKEAEKRKLKLIWALALPRKSGSSHIC